MSPGLQRNQPSPVSASGQFAYATDPGAAGGVSESSKSASAAASAASDFDEMWEEIELHRREPPEKTNYFSSSTVRPNHTGVLCAANDDTLKVRIDNKKDSAPVPIHANYVQLSTTGRYAVGQSPDDKFELGCTRNLIHSLDSGRGLFQFTSRTAHRYDGGRGSANSTIRNERSLSTIASMIEAQRQPSGVLPMLGDRYRITKFEPLPYDPAEKKDVTRYELTARDIHTDEPRTVYITQAGLPFFHKVLEPKQIARAAALLDTHPESILATLLNEAHQQTGPLICSAAGIGRSAVLAVYQDLCKRMPDEVNESNLNVHLEAAIKKGIDTRGPKFLHSKKQVEALREALVAKMREAHGVPFENQRARHNLVNHLRAQAAEPRASSAAVRHDAHAAEHSPQADPIATVDTSNMDPEAVPALRSDHATHDSAVIDRHEERGTVTSSLDIRMPCVPEDSASKVPGTASPQHVDDEAASAAAARNTSSNPMPPAANSNGNMPASTSAGQVGTDPAVIEHSKRGVQKHVSFAPCPPCTSRRSRPTAPDAQYPFDLYRACRDALIRADKNGEKSLEFPPHAVALESMDPNSLPVISVTALLVATVHRYLRDSATALKTAHFDCATDAQKKVYRNLLGRVDTLASHRVFQALLRPFIEDPVQATPAAYFFEKRELAVFVPPEINDSVDNCAEISTPPEEPLGRLNGVEFEPWQDAPTTVEDWNDNTELIDEPALPYDCRAVATVIVEKDRRIWVFAPTNQRGKKNISFPNSLIEHASGLNVQACARKGAYEKSGLQIELMHHLIDMEQGSGTTRYYVAKRIGGTPADAGWKSEAVCLVPMKELRAMFEDSDRCTHAPERSVTEALQQSMLHTRLTNDRTLVTLMERLREWAYHLAPILSLQPDYLEDPMSSTASNLKMLGFNLSNRLNRVVNNWRMNNYRLLDPVGARPGSASVNAATAIETPPGSVVSHLHANYIRVDGCRIAFIAAQRPQTGSAQDAKVSAAKKALRYLQALPVIGSRPPQTEVIERPDNRITFWQTVLHQNVDVIVDLDDAQAKSKEVHYGPSENFPLEIGARALVLTNPKQYGNARVEEITAFDSEGTQRQTITRLHYTAWPEGGTITATDLVDLARRVVLETEGRRAKVLVHSTHGAGRAGTLITFIAASEKIANLLLGPHRIRPEKVIDIVMNLLVRGRAERGQGFVDEKHIPLLFEALLKEHFVGVSNTGVAYEGDLIGRAL